MYFLLYLPPFRQLEEGVGCVEEASLEEEDEGDPLVVGLVLHLPDQKFVSWLKKHKKFSHGRFHSGEFQHRGGWCA